MTARKTLVGKIHPDVLAFTAGNDVVLDRALVEADCIGSAAHVSMLSRLKLATPLFSDAECSAVVGELVAIMRLSRAGQFKIKSSDQDVHLAVERALSAKLGDAGKRVHTARSRNDQVALDLRLFAKDQLLGMVNEAAVLADVLVKLGKRYARVPMVGRTHLQPAMPSSVGVWATAHAESLLDDIEVLQGAYRQNNRCPLGSAAGYGVPLPIDRALTSRLLGFERPVHNVMYASMARGKCESVILAAASQVMLSLSRLAEDMVLFLMPEFGYFKLPSEYCTGSSIMPQKQNPDVFELVRGRASRVLACANAVTGVLKGLPGGYQRDLQETKEPFMDGIAVTRSALKAVALVMGQVQVDRKALERGFSPGVFATDRALELVVSGVPFRDAYREVKENLDALGDVDPSTAIGTKVHEGASAGIDFAAMRKRATEGLRFVKAERKRYYSAVSRLIGVTYPDLQEAI
jgi:argininosuccinate lyase